MNRLIVIFSGVVSACRWRRTRSAGVRFTAHMAAPPIGVRWAAPPFAAPVERPLSRPSGWRRRSRTLWGSRGSRTLWRDRLPRARRPCYGGTTVYRRGAYYGAGAGVAAGVAVGAAAGAAAASSAYAAPAYYPPPYYCPYGSAYNCPPLVSDDRRVAARGRGRVVPNNIHPLRSIPRPRNEDTEMTDLLEKIEDGIAWLTLNRPDRLNAFSPTMLQALGDTLRLGRQRRGRCDRRHRRRTRLLRRR